MEQRNTSQPVSVSLLALPETTPTAIYGLFEVFLPAGISWHELTGEPEAGRRMEPRIVAQEAAPFATPVGFRRECSKSGLRIIVD